MATPARKFIHQQRKNANVVIKILTSRTFGKIADRMERRLRILALKRIQTSISSSCKSASVYWRDQEAITNSFTNGTELFFAIELDSTPALIVLLQLVDISPITAVNRLGIGRQSTLTVITIRP